MLNVIDNGIAKLNHRSSRITARIAILVSALMVLGFVFKESLAFILNLVANPDGAYAVLCLSAVIISYICYKED